MIEVKIPFDHIADNLELGVAWERHLAG